MKNFQLVSDENHNHVILQFGKVRRPGGVTGPDLSAAFWAPSLAHEACSRAPSHCSP